MRPSLLLSILAATGWLLTGPTYSQEKNEFAVAWQKFGQSFSKVQRVNETFAGQMAPHMATFHRYRLWMDDTTRKLSANQIESQDLTLAFQQYRDLLRSDTTCSSASLQTLQQELAGSVADLHKGLDELKGLAEDGLASKKDKLLRASSIKDAEKAAQSADAIVKSYAETIGSSNICLSISNYDLVLVAAETLHATQGTATSLFLAPYLNSQAAERSPEQLKLEAKAYLEAVVSSFKNNMEAGNVAKGVILLNRLDGNIAFGTSASKRLPESDRKELEGLKAQTKAAVKELARTFEFPRFEGMTAMVRNKTMDTYRRLADMERGTVRGSDQEAFARLKEDCEINLGMKPSLPYRIPVLRNLEELLEFEAKVGEVQMRLNALEKSRDLASR